MKSNQQPLYPEVQPTKGNAIRKDDRGATRARNSKDTKPFVFRHAALNKDLTILRKNALTLIINAYCYWTHDHAKTGVSMLAWFTAWGEAYPEALRSGEDGQYSLEYLRVRASWVKTIHEYGYKYNDIKDMGELKRRYEHITKSAYAQPKVEKSPVDKVMVSVEKLTKAQQRALYNRLAKKFG